MIARRRFAAENLHARHPILFRMAADLVIERDGLNQVEQLALIFVDALDLDVEQRVGVQPYAGQVPQMGGEGHLVGALDQGDPFPKCGISGQRVQVLQSVGVVKEAFPNRIAQQAGEVRVALLQPAARRDAVGLVVDLIGVKFVQV